MNNVEIKNAKELREYCMPESGGFVFDDSLFPNPVFDDKKNNIEKQMEG